MSKFEGIALKNWWTVPQWVETFAAYEFQSYFYAPLFLERFVSNPETCFTATFFVSQGGKIAGIA
jgi:hypothetical protein